MMFQKLLGSSTTWLAAVTVVIAALAMSSEAQAGAKAYGRLLVNDTLASNAVTGAILCDDDGGPGPGCAGGDDFSQSLFINNTTAAANLTGFAGIADSDSLDVPLQCLGDCGGIGQNDFTQQPLGDQFSRGDADLSGGGTIIEFNGVATTGADANSVGEVQLTTNNAAGDASGEVTLAGTFTFALMNDTDVRFDFEGDAEVEGLLHPEDLLGSFADADTTFVITIVETASGTTIFSWTVGAGFITGTHGIGFLGGDDSAAIILEPCSLNLTTSNLVPGTTTGGVCSGSFAASTGTLTAGTQYTLSVDHTVNVDALKRIPEPGTLALLGTGLIMLGAFGRKQRKQRSA